MTAELRVVRASERDRGTAEAGPGDFIYVPPEIVHQKINVDANTPVEMIVSRDGQENVVVNVDVPEAEE
jgi:uncharacterized RmlC-like cupin family protein